MKDAQNNIGGPCPAYVGGFHGPAQPEVSTPEFPTLTAADGSMCKKGILGPIVCLGKWKVDFLHLPLDWYMTKDAGHQLGHQIGPAVMPSIGDFPLQTLGSDAWVPLLAKLVVCEG
jgi:hypothetical protein